MSNTTPNATPDTSARQTRSENFVDDIKNDEIKSEIFKEYFRYQNPLFLAEDLLQLIRIEIIK